jgi:hypothetical protein
MLLRLARGAHSIRNVHDVHGGISRLTPVIGGTAGRGESVLISPPVFVVLVVDVGDVQVVSSVWPTKEWLR